VTYGWKIIETHFLRNVNYNTIEIEKAFMTTTILSF